MLFVYNIYLWSFLFFIPIIFKYFDFRNLRSKNFIKYLLNEFGFLKKINFKVIGYALLLSFGLFGLNLLISYLSLVLGLDLQNITLNPILLTNPFFYICLLIFAAFFEELFFRAFLTEKFGIIFSSIIFGILHFTYGSYVQVIGSIILGLILAYAWKKSKNFYIVYLAHLLQNIYSVILIISF
jgi:hypothetical protein